MKSILLILCIICFVLDGFSQSVGIGTTTPNASSMLDVTSTTKGFLFPRMTYTERIAIPSPAQGLLVYQTNSVGLFNLAGVYFFDGSLWKRIARYDEIGSGGGSTGWTVVGDDQYSNLVGNVGIGISAPTSKFHLVGNMLAENGSITMNNPTAILQLQSSGVSKGFFQLSGNNVRIGTNSGNASGKFIVRMNGQEYMTIDTIGQVGIGTGIPKAKLHVEQGTLASYSDNGYLMLGGSFEPNLVISRTEILARNSGGPSQLFLQQEGGVVRIGGTGTTADNTKLHITDGSFANFTTNNGYIMLGEASGTNIVLGNYEILARDNGASAPLILQQEGGAVRIGASGLTASGTRLHITDGANVGPTSHGYLLLGLTAGNNIVMDNDNIQARNNGASAPLVVQNDGGSFRVGTNKLFVDTDGEVGIGTTNPLAKLDVDGRIRVYNSGEAIGIDGSNPSIGLWHNGNQKFYIQQLGDDLQIGKTGGNPNGSIFFGADLIAINTSAPATGYMVSVGGKIICEEIKVQLEPWPDYVFSDTYKAPTIADYAKSIKENKRLPGMPTAEEITSADIGLGEIQRKMMEKIEEMSLFIISQQEEIEALKETVRELQQID